jgi:polyphosphate kinase
LKEASASKALSHPNRKPNFFYEKLFINNGKAQKLVKSIKHFEFSYSKKIPERIMSETAQNTAEIEKSEAAETPNYIYDERDLSWLDFNKRVLDEAGNLELPLYERIKFLAIYSSNRDEFFRVRIAALKSLIKVGKKQVKKALGFKPKVKLKKILKRLESHQLDFNHIFKMQILPELRENGIILVQEKEDFSEKQQNYIRHYFRSKVMGYLQPVVLSEDRGAPFLQNRHLYLAIELKKKSDIDENPAITYAIVNVPSDNSPRFAELPKKDGDFYYIFLDDIVRENLPSIFPGYEVIGSYSIKMNRDADLHIEDEYTGDLVSKIRKRLDKRNIGSPSRFVFDRSMPEEFREFLLNKLVLEEENLVEGGSHHSLYDLFSLPNPIKPKLEGKKFPPLPHAQLEESDSIFNALDQEDCLLHFPYHSYDYVLRFFNEAAIEPTVTDIKLTVYRIATASFIANALISAVKNGKKVTVFVELKARFDEQNNLRWAKQMEAGGVKIIYSIPGLKVHAKVAYVTRTVNGKKKEYAFFGTGNFNESTASIYADHGFFTTDSSLISELKQVFKFLTVKRNYPTVKHLLVAQLNMVARFEELIDREIENAKAGKEACILVKVNSLEDEKMINKLYEASNAGVKIELIVRGICRLVPNVAGMSENIKITRLVDIFLEHARVYYFHNNGESELFMGSADWMHRNLYTRVEVVFPIRDEKLKAEVMQILKFQLEDNTSARLVGENDKNTLIEIAEGEPKRRAQTEIYEWVENGCSECEPLSF